MAGIDDTSKHIDPDAPAGNAGNDDRRRRARRRLIQTLAVGGGITSSKLIPGAWNSPMVKSALLPAHATTSGCVLGNNSLRRRLGGTQNMDPAKETSLAHQLAGMLVPEAEAADDDLVFLRYELTDCFRIVFPCNSDRGTLYATAIDVSADGDSPEMVEIQAPFVSGQNGDLEGYCFKVTLMGGGTYAELRLNIDCNDLYDLEPITLNQNFNCEPFVVYGP